MQTLRGLAVRSHPSRVLLRRVRRRQVLDCLLLLALDQRLAFLVPATFKLALPLQELRLADCQAQLASHKCVLLPL